MEEAHSGLLLFSGTSFNDRADQYLDNTAADGIQRYLGITPQQFFDEGDTSPAQLAELLEDLKKLDAPTLSHISAIVRDILNK